MIKFSKEKVKLLHQLMAQATGGSVGLRDEGLLDSALEGVFAGFGDRRDRHAEPETKMADFGLLRGGSAARGGAFHAHSFSGCAFYRRVYNCSGADRLR